MVCNLMSTTHRAIQRISLKASFVPSSKSESVWDDVKREDQASALAKVETKIIMFNVMIKQVHYWQVETKIIVPQVGPARQRWGQARNINRSYTYVFQCNIYITVLLGNGQGCLGSLIFSKENAVKYDFIHDELL